MLRERAHPVEPNTPRSPQRLTFLAALRGHFLANRRPGAMLAEFDKRRDRAERQESAAAQYAMGRRMVERFADRDRRSGSPVDMLVPATEQAVLGHVVRLGYDVIYGAPEGLILRQLLTDADIRRPEHLRLFATASLLHVEASLGREVAAVEIWQLRFHRYFHWPRWMLLRQMQALGVKLDEVARGLGQDAA
jgi:hypothetical protein